MIKTPTYSIFISITISLTLFHIYMYLKRDQHFCFQGPASPVSGANAEQGSIANAENLIVSSSHAGWCLYPSVSLFWGPETSTLAAEGNTAVLG